MCNCSAIMSSLTVKRKCPIMETLTLTQREQARLQVLNSLLAGHMTMDQAATLMGVSTRHTRRILTAYREEGAAALSHGNRGLRATNATPETAKAEVLRLARSRYSETNHTHLSELLREREGIDIARTTLRRILAGAGVSRVPGSGVRGRGSGERETTASSLADKEESSRKEDNGGQGKNGPAGAVAQGGNGR